MPDDYAQCLLNAQQTAAFVPRNPYEYIVMLPSSSSAALVLCTPLSACIPGLSSVSPGSSNECEAAELRRDEGAVVHLELGPSDVWSTNVVFSRSKKPPRCVLHDKALTAKEAREWLLWNLP